MAINVYDYYENRLALERAGVRVRRDSSPRGPRRFLRRPTFRLPSPSTRVLGVLLGLASGLALALVPVSGHRPPVALLLLLGAVWGFLGGSLVDWARDRSRLVAAALRGEPIGREGARRLVDRRR